MTAAINSTGARSEERFSRNAETDLVCRLLLEKKKELSNITSNGCIHTSIHLLFCYLSFCIFFFNDTATTEIYTLSLHDALPIFNRTLDAINNVFRKFSAFHDETGRLNVDGMNIISNDGSNKLNRSRKARVSYKVQRTINASLNAATSTRAVSSNPNFVTRQKIEIIFG